MLIRDNQSEAMQNKTPDVIGLGTIEDFNDTPISLTHEKEIKKSISVLSTIPAL
jgi:hypothetical protein